ncbi:substrate-binding domain-containing protein [Micromonospora sp. NPDC049523]|uniref:substrate-binding domain-containing protein n=1 Tax=Micromonospora sp. NPDC049523 TaxID=3155921 RepID=UPI003419AFC3
MPRTVPARAAVRPAAAASAPPPWRRRYVFPAGYRILAGLVSLLLLLTGAVVVPSPAWAEPQSAPIAGAGSTWSEVMVNSWRAAVRGRGLVVNYVGGGSTLGRNEFADGNFDFAVSETPYGLDDAFVESDQPPANRPFGYLPVAAGGLAFMYNLQINGRRITNLRLSGDTIARIFTKDITRWDDPRIKADNPALDLPPQDITPVVRSDGSGTTVQLTRWMSTQYPDRWNSFCQARGGTPPCGATAYFRSQGFVSQPLSNGVAGYVAQGGVNGAIGYVETRYALQHDLPVVKVLNQAGYYVGPTADAVAVALTKAEIVDNPSDPTVHLTQKLDHVYTNPDRRAYPLSSYAYMIVPRTFQDSFGAGEGYTLAEFASFGLCEGQQSAPTFGLAPLPLNLVRAGFDQIERIPGAVVRNNPVATCANPTFSPDGTNTLLLTAGQPPECDNRSTGQQCPSASQPVPTTTTLTASSASIGFGEPVTLTAVVVPARATGRVQFRQGVARTLIGSPVEVGADGTASITTSDLPRGSYDLSAVFTPLSANYGASTSESVGITVGAPPADANSTRITAAVAPGTFSLATSDAAALTGGVVGGSATGTLAEVTVVDLRGTNSGWNVTGQVENFTHDGQPGATILGAQLGWTPTAHKTDGSGDVLAGSPVAAGTTRGGLAEGVTLCSARPDSSAGTFACGAGLVLDIPDTAVPGPYSATLTLTLV